MRFFVWLSAAAVIMLGMSGIARADSDCTLKALTLRGPYVFAATGFNIVGGVAQPKAIVEVISFNGDGTLTVPGATRSLNGVIAQIPPGGTGTYTVANPVPNDPACVGSLTFTGGPSFDIFVTPKGEDVWMIQNNANNVFQGTVTKVSR